MASSDAMEAGKAFARRLATDDEFREQTEPSIEKLRLFSLLAPLVSKQIEAAMQPARDKFQAEVKRITREMAAECKRIERDWEVEFGEPYPKSLEAWQRWGARVGFTPKEFGRLSQADLFAWIEGYIQRKRDLESLLNPSRQSDTKTGGAEQTYLPSDLAREFDISTKTLSKYAKKAGVRTPNHGQRNFRYSGGDRMAIINCIAKSTSDSTLAKAARTSAKKRK